MPNLIIFDLNPFFYCILQWDLYRLGFKMVGLWEK